MRVLIIDDKSDYTDQLRRIAAETGLSLIVLTEAYRDQVLHANGTVPSKNLDFSFNLLPTKEQFETESVKKPEHSWNAVKERNKFFNKKR
jgi:hypothetical protein